MAEEKRGRNWRAKYLTVERFDKFLGNDFAHLSTAVVEDNKKIRLIWRMQIAVLAAIIAIPTLFFICIVQIVLQW